MKPHNSFLFNLALILMAALWLLALVNFLRLLWLIVVHNPWIRQQRVLLSVWRKTKLFVTPNEHHSTVGESFRVGVEFAEQALADRNKELDRVWVGLQDIKLGVDGRSQVMDIHLLLDRKSLRLIDVEDAARLLAARTEQIYLDAIKKRLQQDKNNQPKEIKNAN